MAKGLSGRYHRLRQALARGPWRPKYPRRTSGSVVVQSPIVALPKSGSVVVHTGAEVVAVVTTLVEQWLRRRP
jgi:hypothetical protein